MRFIADFLPFQPFLQIDKALGAEPRVSTLPPFGMRDHLRLLHPQEARGHVIFGQHRGEQEWEQTAVPVQQQEEYAVDLTDRVDQYVTCQTFYGRRKKGRLAQLGRCYVDLDYYNAPKWQGSGPESVAEQVLATLQGMSYPPPGFMLSSGRGLLVMWLHRPMPAAALRRWTAVQQHLFDALGQFGPDSSALDPCRVFRLVGTRNRKSGQLVRPIYQHPELWTGKRQSFEALAAAVLPVSRQDLVQRRIAREPRKPGSKIRPPRTLTRKTYYIALLDDVKRLVEYRWRGRIPDGERTPTLLCMAIASAHLVPLAQLEQEICGIAHTFAGWSPGRAKRMASSVIGRAKARLSMGGEDGPYGMTAKKAIEMLAIEPAEMRGADLRVLIDAQVRRERATERKRRSRRAAGMQSRGQYREERACKAASDAAATRAAVARCGSLEAAAAELGVSIGALKKRLQRLQAPDTVCHR